MFKNHYIYIQGWNTLTCTDNIHGKGLTVSKQSSYPRHDIHCLQMMSYENRIFGFELRDFRIEYILYRLTDSGIIQPIDNTNILFLNRGVVLP